MQAFLFNMPPPPWHTHMHACMGAARPRGNRMLIIVSCTEALAWARVQLREGTGSSPFAGQSYAERALVMTADPETRAGLPL